MPPACVILLLGIRSENSVPVTQGVRPLGGGVNEYSLNALKRGSARSCDISGASCTSSRHS